MARRRLDKAGYAHVTEGDPRFVAVLEAYVWCEDKAVHECADHSCGIDFDDDTLRPGDPPRFMHARVQGRIVSRRDDSTIQVTREGVFRDSYPEMDISEKKLIQKG